MAKHKKQHYIPSSYLKAWCEQGSEPNEEPFVWIFSKDGNTSKRKAPKNKFYEKDMYTIECPKAGRNLELEHGLSQLEGLFSELRKKKLENRKTLTDYDKLILCTFMAVMKRRTVAYREHAKNQWGKVVEKMDQFRDSMLKLEPEKRKPFSVSNNTDNSMSYDDVKEVCDKPLQNSLYASIVDEAPMLALLDLAIMCSNDKVNYITSDNPCIWFDPEGYKRPPMFQGPGLAYESIEITIPISPTQIAFLNRKGLTGYIDITDRIYVDEINRRMRFYCDKEFVVNKNKKEDWWFRRFNH